MRDPRILGSWRPATHMLAGLDIPRVISQMDDTSGIRCAFSSGEKLKEVLRRLKEEDLGLCVTVSGIVDDVFAMCDEVGLMPPPLNLSLGVHGNTELLARATRCGSSPPCAATR